MKLADRVQASLFAVVFVALPLIMRCVVYERWVTLFGALMLVVGALAAIRWRTWGVGLVLCAGTAFPTAHLLGMAPAWFWGVGVAAALPFALSWRPMAFFDRSAAALYAVVAVGGGITCALAFYEYGAWVEAVLCR